jgi:hypothetical protein
VIDQLLGNHPAESNYSIKEGEASAGTEEMLKNIAGKALNKVLDVAMEGIEEVLNDSE